MSSFIEINDALRITKEQGFPAELDLETHIASPYSFDGLEGKVFHFTSKPKYVSIKYEKEETSGSFKIIRLNTADEMKEMFKLTHFTNSEQNYFID